MLWLRGMLPWVPQAPVEWTQPGLIEHGHVTFTLLGLAWPVAYLTLVLGYRRAGQWTASLAVAADVLHEIERVGFGVARPVVVPATVVFGGLVLVALLAFHREASVRVRWWLASFGVGAALATGFVALAWIWQPDEALFALLDWAGLDSVVLVPAALVYLVVVLVRPARRYSPWSLAFALLASAVLGLRLLTLPDLPRAAVGVGLAEALALVTVCVPMAALAARALRRLSPLPSGSAEESLG
jgi:hypothetical protein